MIQTEEPAQTTRTAVGIDIGGTGMKAALVDLVEGSLVTERVRYQTPQPATPAALAGVFTQLMTHFPPQSRVGSTFPGVIRQQRQVETAANLVDEWIGVDAAELFGTESCDVVVLNDADAAGLAEMRYGAGVGAHGAVFMLTIGTGLGTALFNKGELVPNLELGHIEIDGVDAEELASSRARKQQQLTLEAWAGRLSNYLDRIESLVSPDLIIIGGGISKQFDAFVPFLSTRAELVPAKLRNHAGIVGAALAASI